MPATPQERSEPQVVNTGLWLHRGAAPPMREFHRHDDLEINIALRGGLDYLFGGSRLQVPEGTTAMFWAATPHRLIDQEATEAATETIEDSTTTSDVFWIHLPLTLVLRWSLPESFTRQILSHQTLLVPTAALGDHLLAQLTSWRNDLDHGRSTESIELEANALVLRILRAGESVAPRIAGSTAKRHELRPVAQLARYTAEHFREPISTADIARSANLNPNYATTLFREWFGVTLGDQLVRHRVAEAQRLLITTDLTTTAVAHAAGFGSQSSLYAHFARACGCSPGAYRARTSTK